MTDFRLSGLTPSLLEKVITKLDEKSYFHLQQTCHEMNDFVRKSQNIVNSVHMEGDFFLCFTKGWTEKEILCQYRPANCDKSSPRQIDLADLYGIRLAGIQINKDAEDFDAICDHLKMQRLTCVELDFLELSSLPDDIMDFGKNFGIQSKWTDEQVLALLEIVRPQKVYAERNFGPLFQSKSIESVHIEAGLKDALYLFPRLLDTFPDVYISTAIRGDQFILIRAVLKALQLRPFPNLRRFVFKIDGGSGRSNTDFEDMELIELPDHHLTKVFDDGSDWLIADVKMPENFTLEVCQIMLHTDSVATIYCGKREDRVWKNTEENTQDDGKDEVEELLVEEKNGEDDV